VRILVTADTHMGPTRRYRLPQALLDEAAEADVILHAGDLTDPDVLLELGAYAPVHAVLGNNDPLASLLPEQLVTEVTGVSLGMIHDPGPERGRRERLRRIFPRCRVVVFGHTHLPLNDDQSGLLLLNPGSPTERRRAPHRSFARLDVAADGTVSARILRVPEA
jgi:putative phosphoesterase